MADFFFLVFCFSISAQHIAQQNHRNRDFYVLFLLLFLLCGFLWSVATSTTSTIANRQRHQLGARLACISFLLRLHLTLFFGLSASRSGFTIFFLVFLVGRWMLITCLRFMGHTFYAPLIRDSQQLATCDFQLSTLDPAPKAARLNPERSSPSVFY